MTDLEMLAAAATAVEEVKVTERPVVACPAEVHKPFSRFMSAKAIYDVVEARMEVEKDATCKVMLDTYLEVLFSTGCRPTNPKIALACNEKPDLEAIFQVHESYSFNIQKGKEPIGVRITNALVEAGLAKEKAERLVKSELDCTSKTALRPFNELMEGHFVKKQFVEATADEKAVAQKLVAFVLGKAASPLTEKERKLVLVTQDKVVVKEGYLQRLAGYCSDMNDVRAVFAIIIPKHYLSHTKFGVSDSPTARCDRMLEEFKLVIKEKKEKEAEVE